MSDVKSFAALILHGDAEHRSWLLEAAECYESGRPIPLPRSSKKPWARYLLTGAIALVTWFLISSPWIILTWLLM